MLREIWIAFVLAGLAAIPAQSRNEPRRVDTNGTNTVNNLATFNGGATFTNGMTVDTAFINSLNVGSLTGIAVSSGIYDVYSYTNLTKQAAPGQAGGAINIIANSSDGTHQAILSVIQAADGAQVSVSGNSPGGADGEGAFMSNSYIWEKKNGRIPGEFHMQMNGSKDGMGQVVLQHYNIVDGNMVQNYQYFSVNGSTFTVGDITNESAVVDMVYKCTGSTGGLMDGAIAAGNSNAALCTGGTWIPTALQLVTIPAENSRRLK